MCSLIYCIAKSQIEANSSTTVYSYQGAVAFAVAAEQKCDGGGLAWETVKLLIIRAKRLCAKVKNWGGGGGGGGRL